MNRGGLFFVSDEVYTFFLELEKKTRSYLPELIRQGKVNKAVVLGEITADDSVQFFWCIVSTDIEDEAASEELLYKVVELWLTIRGFSIAGSYVEYYKQCNKASTKKKKSLRKGLKQKHEASQLHEKDKSSKACEPEDKQSSSDDKQSDIDEHYFDDIDEQYIDDMDDELSDIDD